MKIQTVFAALLLILLTSNFYAQSGWVWLNPKPYGNGYTDVEFADENTGYASADGGVILKTTNGGLEWFRLFIPVYLKFIDISVVSSDVIYSITQDRYYVKSADGGASWQVIDLGAASSLWKIEFLNSNTGYITYGTRILKTTNGGLSHDTLTLLGTPNIFDMDFINANTGYVTNDENLGAFIIQKTTNGGMNWFYVYNVTAYQENFRGIYFIDVNTGFAYSTFFSHRYIKTTNGGNSWININGFNNYSVYSMSFFNSTTGYAGSNMLFKTTDGGSNWIANSSVPPINTFAVISSEKLVSPAAFTTNSGNNWVNLITSFTGKDLKDVFFINSLTGYIIGNGQYNEAAKIFKTTDAGESWVSNDIDSVNVNKLQFVNENIGFVLSTQNTIYKTTNGGTSWLDLNIEPNNIETAVHFINENTGYFSAASRDVYKTTNSGINWLLSGNVNSGGIGVPQAIQFVNEQTGFITRLNTVHRTTNSGVNWEIVYTLPSGNGVLKNLYFPGENTGYVPLRYNKVIKTTNNGSTWQEYIVDNIDSNSGFEGASIHFINVSTGYIGRTEKIYKTTNGGLNWTRNYVRTNSLFNSLFMTSADTCYLVGENGFILKTTAGAIGINPINNELPKTYNLYQSYPNPFNPRTVIRFDISENAHVKLIIYDLLGREVITLVDEMLNTGTYNVQWEALNYASGVYFYSLIAKDFAVTKKMVLVK